MNPSSSPSTGREAHAPRKLSRTVLSLFSLTIAGTAIVLTAAAMRVRQSMIEDRDARASRIAGQAAVQTDRLCAESKTLLRALADDADLTVDPERIHASLTRAQRYRPILLALAWAARDGELLASTAAFHPPVNVAQDPCFRHALQSDGVVFGPWGVDAATGHPCVRAGFAPRARDGEVRAILLATLDLGEIEQAVAAAGLADAGRLLLVDATGFVLARRPDPEREVGRVTSDDPLVTEVLRLREGTAEIADSQGAPRRYAVTELAPAAGGSAFVAVGLAAPADAGELQGALGAALAGLALVALFGAVGIRRATHRLARLAEQVAPDPPPAPPAPPADEVGAIRLLEARTREFGLLDEMVETLLVCERREQAYEVVGRFGAHLFPRVAGSLFTFDVARNCLQQVARWGAPPASSAPKDFATTDCWAMRRGQAHLIETGSSGAICTHFGPRPPAASLCLPLMAQGETLGLLAFALPDAAPGGRTVVSERMLRLAQRLAGHIAPVLVNLKLRETLEDQSAHDPLTGLFNRRFLEESLERELRRAARAGHSVGVIMLDLDHFKEFNDRHGHPAGDTLLRALASLLRTQFRQEDVVCRYGGEEFLVVLPMTTLAEATRRATIIHEKVARLRVSSAGQPLSAITVSIGVAEYPIHAAEREQLLRAADRALYRAKAEGRNRVCVSTGSSAVAAH